MPYKDKEKRREYARRYQEKNIEKMREVSRRWYSKNKELHKNNIKERQKETNYSSKKTEIQKEIRNIKRRTRNHFPLKGKDCEICGDKAEVRHHTTNPIEYNKFEFLCHGCHVRTHIELNNNSKLL